MQIRAGYEISYHSSSPTPMLMLLNVHPSREADLITPDVMNASASSSIAPISTFFDQFGNKVTRLVTPPGEMVLRADFLINDTGLHDDQGSHAEQWPVEELPDDVLVYLLASRYCDTEHLSDFAWAQFGNGPTGWARVQSIVDYTHNRIRFGYQHANRTRTASQGHFEQVGVCRDFAHLAVTLCRCMNIPARYCTGYLGDIGVPIDPAPMDFSAWFEVFLGGRWWTFDARHNHPRIGRVVMARGRDATDVAISTAFGSAALGTFKVITEEVRV